MMALKKFEYMADGTPELQLIRDGVKANEKVTRSWAVQAVSSVQQHTAQRAATIAVELSRLGLYEAVAGVCNAALASLIELCYEIDSDRLPANIDPATGRILIPLPWGASGYRRYGLRSTESKVLRALMQDRQTARRGHVRLWYYETENRSWYLNSADYRNVESARAYLDHWPVRSAEVRIIWSAQNKRRRKTD